MVLMPEYLKSSSKQITSKPRIISEVKKNCLSELKLSFTTSLQDFEKSKFSGQLLWNRNNSEWVLRTGVVRQGSLILTNEESSTVELRLPLRELNLRQYNMPRSFCLTEAEGLGVQKFQAPNDEDYEKWVRILAVELIRQTPLQNVRFLDILSIIRNNESDKGNLRRGKSEEFIAKAEKEICNKLISRSPLEPINRDVSRNIKLISGKTEVMRKGEELKKMKIRVQNSLPLIYEKENGERTWLRTQSMNNLANPKDVSDESGISSGDDNINDSISQNADNFSFLSVRERKKFFESLNCDKNIQWPESSPLSRSNSIGNLKNFSADRNKFRKRKRTKSLHDLHKTPVKEICQLFESREFRKMSPNEDTSENNAMVLLTQRRLQRGERKLEKLKTQIMEVEENIKIVTEDLSSIERNNLIRQSSYLHSALQRRLKEESSRLDRLMQEMTKIIKGNQRTIMKLEKCNEKSSFDNLISS